MMDEAGLIRGGSGRGPAQQYHDEDDDAYSSDGSMKVCMYTDRDGRCRPWCM